MQPNYLKHLEKVSSEFDRHLKSLNYDHLIVDAGDLEYFFADDQSKNFKPTPLFNYLCPLSSQGHVIHYTPGTKPTLFYYQPDDFWYDVQPPENSYWNKSFFIKICGSLEDIWNGLQGLKNAAYIGPNQNKAIELGFKFNPQALIDRTDWQRSFKSDYEVDCLIKAEEIAGKGHKAAKESFLAGDSELEIHQAYMRAIGTIESKLPYWSIVALNEKGAILHYEKKRDLRNGSVLLIDSGATFNHYCSDITRTHCADQAHPVFKNLLVEMDKAQLRLCDAIKPGIPYPELHHLANVEIFEILSKSDIIKGIQLDEAIDKDIVKTFFPHGLGHLLGIQVHDVGGHLANEEGGTLPAPTRYPKLRTTRTLEAGVVLTVEPGLYFIPSLLQKMKASENSKFFNWSLIDELTPFGGMRIEDNVLVQKDGVKNLTRPFVS